MSRQTFREECVERDGGECIVVKCDEPVTADPDGPGEVHHIIERELWVDGGYEQNNGASVCNMHHRMAEDNRIPPQAFWRWADVDVIGIPDEHGITYTNPRASTDVFDVDKWGEVFDTPPHDDLREYPKYPSSRHMLPCYWHSDRGTQEERTGRDDTGMTDLGSLQGLPLVMTIKMDGSNAMLVKDSEQPVRARNGRDAEHESFDHLKQEYWDRNVYENIPEYYQVFGENMYAKHSIHYGCDGCCKERNQAPPVDDVFLVFGVYDTRYNLWLSWPETEEVADDIGFETAPVVAAPHDFTDDPRSEVITEFERERPEVDLAGYTTSLAEQYIDRGHEGLIVRSAYPFHYGQFGQRLGKFVRPNHVETDEHWSHQEVTRNEVR